MIALSIRELVGLYEDLDSAIFFDGIGEFLCNEKYTNDEWKKKANLFLSNYQEVLKSNTAVAKFDYLLREEECELLATYQNAGLSRTKTTSRNIDLAALMENGPDEPFEEYFELKRKMAIPIEALRKTLEECGDFAMLQGLPPMIKDTSVIGDFVFVFRDEKIVSVRYKDKFLNLYPKESRIFFCILRKYYDSGESISVEDIKASYHNQTDSYKYFTSMVSKINKEVKVATGSSKLLIVSSKKRQQKFFTVDSDFFEDL